jgi:hypothetical protein
MPVTEFQPFEGQLWLSPLGSVWLIWLVVPDPKGKGVELVSNSGSRLKPEEFRAQCGHSLLLTGDTPGQVVTGLVMVRAGRAQAESVEDYELAGKWWRVEQGLVRRSEELEREGA